MFALFAILVLLPNVRRAKRAQLHVHVEDIKSIQILSSSTKGDQQQSLVYLTNLCVHEWSFVLPWKAAKTK